MMNIREAINWLRRNASAEREPAARAALVEAHNAVLALAEGDCKELAERAEALEAARR